MHGKISWIMAAALTFSAPSLAAGPAAPLAPVHSLSQAEVDRILDEAAAKHQRTGMIADDIEAARPRPQIHGEVGFGIGTGGYRSAFGTAFVPLGDEARAIISFDSTDFGSRGFPYDHPFDR